MSYDLEIVASRPGIAPDTLMSGVFERDLDDRDPGVTQALSAQTRRRLTNALLDNNPGFEVFPAGYAAQRDAPTDESPDQIELTDAARGIQISMSDDGLGVSVPFSHRRQPAEATFRQLWRYLEVVQNTLAVVIYDRQLGKILDLAKDFNQALSVYTRATGA